MACTKILPIRTRLCKTLDYTDNPEKTQLAIETEEQEKTVEYGLGDVLNEVLQYTQNEVKTENYVLTRAYNCSMSNAYQAMMNTKKKWKKADDFHVQGYHIIQSFAKGEVTYQQAFEIGCEFAERYLVSNYEVTVCAHTNTEHPHCHIVFNSVRFTDGTMFQNKYKDYYSGIRKISDDLCREHGLSILVPEGTGKKYNEYLAEKSGKPTIRSGIRKDVDKALSIAVSWSTFVMTLENMGYTVRYGKNIKYATLKSRDGQKSIRFRSLGAGYSEKDLREKLNEKMHQPHSINSSRVKKVQPTKVRRVRYRGRLSSFPKRKITGFMALYYRYFYLFKKTRSYSSPARSRFLLREDLSKLNRYITQAKFIWERKIETETDLKIIAALAQEQLVPLAAERKKLYRTRSRLQEDADIKKVTAQINELTEKIKLYRKELELCSGIENNTDHLKDQVRKTTENELDQKNQQKRKEKSRYEYRR